MAFINDGCFLIHLQSSWEDQDTRKVYSCVDLYFVSQVRYSINMFNIISFILWWLIMYLFSNLIAGWFCFQVKIQVPPLFLCSLKGLNQSYMFDSEIFPSTISCLHSDDDYFILGENGNGCWSIFETTIWKSNCWYWNSGERRPWSGKHLPPSPALYSHSTF